MDMGFLEETAGNALEITEGDMEQATLLLLESPHTAEQRSSKKIRKNGNHTEKKTRPKEEKPIELDYQERKDFFLQEQADQQQKVFAVDYSDGLLSQLYKYLMHRIPALNQYCVICDGAHLFASSHLLRPAVCARELCCFAFQALGVCAGATDGIATQAEVVDLLVCMAHAAAASSRHEVIFNPYPTVFDPSDASVVFLNPHKKDFPALKRILSNFPSVEQMTLAQEAKDIKEQMDRADIYAFPLLQWIVNSNRSHIEKLQPNKQIKGMNTPHQYVLITAPPEKEEVFSRLKAKYGTTFAFHGSPVENWHCILRLGLKNASGTNLQLHGAAYGKGIYLSPAASMSFGYSSRFVGVPAAPAASPARPASQQGNRFLSSTEFHCVALCEVANVPDIKKNGEIWVCPDEDAVVTRFFFVFPKSQHQATAPPSAHTSHATFLTEIEAALKTW